MLLTGFFYRGVWIEIRKSNNMTCPICHTSYHIPCAVDATQTGAKIAEPLYCPTFDCGWSVNVTDGWAEDK